MTPGTMFSSLTKDVGDSSRAVSTFSDVFRGLSYSFDFIERKINTVTSGLDAMSEQLSGCSFIQNNLTKSFIEYSSSLDRLARSTSNYGLSTEIIEKRLLSLRESTKLSQTELIEFYNVIDSKLVGMRNFDGIDKMIERVKEIGKNAKNSLEIVNSLLSIQSKFGTSNIGMLSPSELMSLNRDDFKNAITYQLGGIPPESRAGKVIEGAQQLESTSQQYKKEIGETITQPLIDVGKSLSIFESFGSKMVMTLTAVGTAWNTLGGVFGKGKSITSALDTGGSGSGSLGSLGSSEKNPMYVQIVGGGGSGVMGTAAAVSAGNLLTGTPATAAGGGFFSGIGGKIGLLGLGGLIAGGSQMAKPWLQETLGGGNDAKRSASMVADVGGSVAGGVVAGAAFGPWGMLAGGAIGLAAGMTSYLSVVRDVNTKLDDQKGKQNEIVSSIMKQYDQYQQTSIINDRILSIVKDQVSAYNSLSQTYANNLYMGKEAEESSKLAAENSLREVQLEQRKYEIAQKAWSELQSKANSGDNNALKEQEELQQSIEKEMGFRIGSEDARKKELQWKNQILTAQKQIVDSYVIEQGVNLKQQQAYTSLYSKVEDMSKIIRLGMGAEIGAILNTTQQLNIELGIQQEAYKGIQKSIADTNAKEQAIRSDSGLTAEDKKKKILELQAMSRAQSVALVNKETDILGTQEKIFSKLLTMREKYVEALPESGFAGFDVEFDPTRAAGMGLFGAQNQFVGGRSGGGLGVSSGGVNPMGGMAGFNGPNAYGAFGPYSANLLMYGAAYASQQTTQGAMLGGMYHTGGVVGEKEGVPPGREMLIKAMSGEVVVPGYEAGGITGTGTLGLGDTTTQGLINLLYSLGWAKDKIWAISGGARKLENKMLAGLFNSMGYTSEKQTGAGLTEEEYSKFLNKNELIPESKESKLTPKEIAFNESMNSDQTQWQNYWSNANNLINTGSGDLAPFMIGSMGMTQDDFYTQNTNDYNNIQSMGIGALRSGMAGGLRVGGESGLTMEEAGSILAQQRISSGNSNIGWDTRQDQLENDRYNQSLSLVNTQALNNIPAIYPMGESGYNSALPTAARGGLMNGPTGGFLAELHDSEVVLNDNQVRNLNLSSADFSKAGVPGFGSGGATGGSYPSGVGNMTIQSECPSCAQKRTIQTVSSTLGLGSSNDIQTGMAGSTF